MIITKEQQERILQKYINEKHNTDECIGFIDGINSTIELINKLTIHDVSNQRELLIAFMEYLSELTMGIDYYDQEELLNKFESNL